MNGARRSAYLDALGIDVYVPRDIACVPEPPPVERPSEMHAPGDEVIAGLGWEMLEEAVSRCTRCPLHETRTRSVFGVGNRNARWMVIGEAPGAEEDRRGEPFVGRAGQLLNEMLRAVGYSREDVFITNVLKCRPPGNRDPKPDEAASCRGYLERQIELVSPTLIVAVGRVAAQNLLATSETLGRLRGRLHSLGPRGLPVLVTYHPAYLLRSPGEKRKSWADLLLAMQAFRRLEAGRVVSS
jgi:uracil-DNA glycosylase